jgi:hypothetical protein
MFPTYYLVWIVATFIGEVKIMDSISLVSNANLMLGESQSSRHEFAPSLKKALAW